MIDVAGLRQKLQRGLDLDSLSFVRRMTMMNEALERRRTQNRMEHQASVEKKLRVFDKWTKQSVPYGSFKEALRVRAKSINRLATIMEEEEHEYEGGDQAQDGKESTHCARSCVSISSRDTSCEDLPAKAGRRRRAAPGSSRLISL